MAQELVAHYGSERPVKVLALLNGALWFAADLLRLLPPNFVLETVRVSSYGAGRETSGTLH
jgi:hypoxanthine-guanine phosphoribosyltransferase